MPSGPAGFASALARAVSKSDFAARRGRAATACLRAVSRRIEPYTQRGTGKKNIYQARPSHFPGSARNRKGRRIGRCTLAQTL